MTAPGRPPAALSGLVLALAVAVALASGVLIGWRLIPRPTTTTINPPCYVNVPGFQLPPGGKWC